MKEYSVKLYLHNLIPARNSYPIKKATKHFLKIDYCILQIFYILDIKYEAAGSF